MSGCKNAAGERADAGTCRTIWEPGRRYSSPRATFLPTWKSPGPRLDRASRKRFPRFTCQAGGFLCNPPAESPAGALQSGRDPLFETPRHRRREQFADTSANPRDCLIDPSVRLSTAPHSPPYSPHSLLRAHPCHGVFPLPRRSPRRPVHGVRRTGFCRARCHAQATQMTNL